MREGDSLQSQVDRGNLPMWNFYERMEIPAEIVDPKKKALGTTKVTNRGLVEGNDRPRSNQ